MTDNTKQNSQGLPPSAKPRSCIIAYIFQNIESFLPVFYLTLTLIDSFVEKLKTISQKI